MPVVNMTASSATLGSCLVIETAFAASSSAVDVSTLLEHHDHYRAASNPGCILLKVCAMIDHHSLSICMCCHLVCFVIGLQRQPAHLTNILSSGQLLQLVASSD